MEGYGLYWRCVELVAEQGQNCRISSKNSWKSALKHLTRMSEEKMNTILECLADLDLINKNAYKQLDLFIPNLKKHSDDYTKRVRRVFVDDTKNVRPDKIRIDNIRIDKKRREEKPTFSTINEIKQLTNSPFDTEDLKVLEVLYKLGFRLKVGEERELSKWFDGLHEDYDIDHSKEIEKFKLYWEAQSKKLKTHKLAWRNWLSNAIEFKKKQNG